MTTDKEIVAAARADGDPPPADLPDRVRDAMNAYPEHDKLIAVANKSQAIGEFLEWLPSQDIHLGQPTASGDYLHFAHPDTTKLLAAFFGIDLDVIDAEKRAMLAALQERSG